MPRPEHDDTARPSRPPKWRPLLFLGLLLLGSALVYAEMVFRYGH
ncbi:MAG: hypothetical protein ACQEVT_13355 [Pseudomonadota bacterium]|nr:hypothetical protein [Roseovarius sp. EGI FJ00037]MCZ0813375.1 hypothetical protein [Roseovarius sp. EGI FJ00037]